MNNVETRQKKDPIRNKMMSKQRPNNTNFWTESDVISREVQPAREGKARHDKAIARQYKPR